MSTSRSAMVPGLLYFDTSVLDALPFDLASPDADTLRSFSSELGIKMFVPETALREWLAHCQAKVTKLLNGVRAGIPILSPLLECDFSKVCDTDPEALRKRVQQVQLDRLAEAGFTVAAAPPIDAGDLVRMCLRNEPPFRGGDKGFKDALIVETVLHYASLPGTSEVVLATGDRDFTAEAIVKRFREDAEAVLTVVFDERPERVIPQLMELYRTRVESVVLETRERNNSAALAYLNTRKGEVFEFVMRTAKFHTRSLYLAAYLSEDGPLAKLRDARVESVDEVHPMAIKDVELGPKTEPLSGRRKMTFRVAVELKLTVSRANWVPDPSVSLADAVSITASSLPRSRLERAYEQAVVEIDYPVNGSVVTTGRTDIKFDDLRLDEPRP